MKNGSLIDAHGRVIGSVRLSVTDRCNLRCQYCMPEDGIEWVKKDEILTFEEIVRLVKFFYRRNIRKFRLTGGEPTIRKDLPNLVSMIKSQMQDINLAMTTNGINLSELAEPLKEAGLNRLNISLDTLNHVKFNKMTRRDAFEKVINGIDQAINAGFEKIKINAVSIKNFNDDVDSLLEFVDFAEEKGIEIRFIELMPFTGNNWENGGFVSSKTLRDKLGKLENLVKLEMKDKSSTSKTWSLRGGKAKMGFISSVSESFCENCNRIRITAEGKLRPCLHNGREYDLKSIIRGDNSDKKLLQIINKGLKEKWKEHPDFLALNYNPPIDDREMIRIGG